MFFLQKPHFKKKQKNKIKQKIIKKKKTKRTQKRENLKIIFFKKNKFVNLIK